jgi:hypothetical protein
MYVCKNMWMDDGYNSKTKFQFQEQITTIDSKRMKKKKELNPSVISKCKNLNM